MQVNDANVLKYLEPQIMQQLTERGEYCPVELLIAIGRLLYIDYEEWRRGKQETLDASLVNSGMTKEILQQAKRYALQIGLKPEPIEWTPWIERSIEPLRGSRYTELNQLLSCRFVPARDEMQLDLFYDHSKASAENRVLEDLVKGDLAVFSTSLAELYSVDPSHSSLGLLDHLKRYMQHCHSCSCTATSLKKELQVLAEKIVPIAHTVLKNDARCFLSRYWDRLIACCRDIPVNERPELGMLSRLSWEVSHWQGVIDATAAELSIRPTLDILVRRALAFDRSHFLAQSLQVWFEIALLYPLDFPNLMIDQPNIELRLLWEDFENREEMQVESFPAFCLLSQTALSFQSSLADILSGASLTVGMTFKSECVEEINPERYRYGFNILQTVFKLIMVDQEASPSLAHDHAQRSIELRQCLSDRSPQLMQLYLESRCI